MRRLAWAFVALLFVSAIAFAATRPDGTSTVATRTAADATVAAPEPSAIQAQASASDGQAASGTTTSAPPNGLLEIETTTSTTTTLLPQRVPEDPPGAGEQTQESPELPTVTLPPEVPELDITEEREPKGALPDDSSGQGSDADIDAEEGEAGEVYVWYDGEEERRVRVVPNQTEDPIGDSPRNTNDTAGRAATVDAPGRAEPAFIDESTDETLTWDGGILILLDPEWTDADTTSFFAAQGFTPDRIEPLPLQNAFVIAVNASPSGLLLAAQLAQLDGVLSASPDWSDEFEPL